MKVHRRKLRARHLVLRDHERRSRLVVGDARRRKLGRAALSGPRPDLARARAAGRQPRPAPPPQRFREARALDASCTTPVDERKSSQQAVSRILSPSTRRPRRLPDATSSLRVTTIPLASPSLARSSDRPGGLGRAVQPPYLVLLRAGFCLPPTLRPARCALTAPFHPYPPSPCELARRARLGLPRRSREAAKAGGIFSVPLSFRLP